MLAPFYSPTQGLHNNKSLTTTDKRADANALNTKSTANAHTHARTLKYFFYLTPTETLLETEAAIEINKGEINK